MEPTTIFALFIGLISVVHFLDRFAEKMRSRKQTKIATKREKWYCFFADDALTDNKQTKDDVVQNVQHDIINDRARRRVQELRRPVLRL